jgi:hypothetical protein
MIDRLSLGGPVLARVYAALVYVASLVLLFGAAVLTATHARVAFIFVFLPGVLLAVLSIFIWSGRRSAMLLALAVATVLELMMVANDPGNWGLFLAMPVVFGVLTVLAFIVPEPSRVAGQASRIADEVYAAVVYFSGLLAAFMAPFNHSRHFGWIGVGLYALSVGAVLGGLSVAIWRGKTWAMLAAFALALAHWLVFAGIDRSFWLNVPHLAAPVVSGILTAVCIAAAARAKAKVKTG